MSIVGRIPRLHPFYADEFPDDPHRWYIEDQYTFRAPLIIPEVPPEDRPQQKADVLAIIAVLNAAADAQDAANPPVTPEDPAPPVEDPQP